jgi:membrane protein implicated in regulation of membrane protease activity
METYIWLALIVLFLVVEGLTVGLVSTWFAVGALAAMIVSSTGGSVAFQVGVFLVVSATMLACLRPILRKYVTPKRTKTNVDAIIGMEGYVTADIDNLSATGSVKLGTMEWSARSASGAPIKTGTRVRAEKIEGVKVFVAPVEIPAEV